MVDALSEGHADAISVASLIHYDAVENIEIDNLSEVAFGLSAENRNARARIKHIALNELKRRLIAEQFDLKLH